LIEEIKSRARSSFAVGNYPEAEVLYTKGIEVLSTTSQPDAILLANRALARLNLGKVNDAIADSELAIEADGNYVKGYWRLGQAYTALGDHKKSLKAFEDGLKVEPGNKALVKEADKARSKVEQESMFEDGPPPIAAQSPTKKAVSSSSASSASSASKKAVSGSSSKAKQPPSPMPPDAATKEDEKDADDFNKSDHVRGYKINKDGKKTSFFNNDLTDEAKQLIGDITPKQIVSEVKGVEEKGKSAWNHAGTWEEKDCTAWCNEAIKERVGNAKFVLPSGCEGAEVVVDSIDKFEGSASVATVRGKRRFIYEYIFSVKWSVELDCGKCTGTLHFPDVAPDCEGVFESEYSIDSKVVPPEVRPLLQKYVKMDSGSFKEEVVKGINGFIQEFIDKYS
jgi:activator of HSP90 ATPase